MKKTFKQAGVTLLELIAALAIVAIIIVGALSLYNSANSSNTSTQMTKDLVSIRSAVLQLFQGQGGYGTVSLNSTLISAQRIPTTLSVSGATITNQQSGTVTITGATSTFTVVETNITQDVCIAMLAASTGWTSVKVGASAAITTFPISPATASTNCAAGVNSITWTN